MNLNFGKLWDSAQHMIDSIMARLPSLVVAIAVFVLFYILRIFVGRILRSATRAHRQNLGMAFAGRNHPAGFFGCFLNCCPFLPGG